MLMSSDADARKTPSGDQAISELPAVCPFKLRTRTPVKGFHILTTLSAPVFSQVQSQALTKFPKNTGLTTRCQDCPVWAEFDRRQRLSMSAHGMSELIMWSFTPTRCGWGWCNCGMRDRRWSWLRVLTYRRRSCRSRCLSRFLVFGYLRIIFCCLRCSIFIAGRII